MRLQNLLRPEYVLRPWNIARRVLRNRFDRQSSLVVPIGRTKLKLQIRAGEYLGQNLLTFRLYDLAITEALVRLVQPGQTVVDVGANIGYTSVLMCDRVGPAGRVLSFEPVPQLFARLNANLQLNGFAEPRVRTFEVAASDEHGRTAVEKPAGFEQNEGILSLTQRVNAGSSSALVLETRRLSDVLPDIDQIDLMKIDVEGHELQVLRGANDWIAQHRVRTVIFEDHSPYPSPTTSLLEGAGYRIWRLDCGMLGPRLIEPARAVHSLEPNWVATIEPDLRRFVGDLTRRGWSVL